MRHDIRWVWLRYSGWGKGRCWGGFYSEVLIIRGCLGGVVGYCLCTAVDRFDWLVRCLSVGGLLGVLSTNNYIWYRVLTLLIYGRLFS